MKKSLIALAIASAVSAPAFAATSNVDIYGLFNLDLNYVNGDVSNKDKSFGVTSDASRIGFKGTEDLGGGLAAVWQIESGFNADEGSGTLGSRNTFLGLKGNFGTVLAGRHDTPMKMLGRKVDNFGDLMADSRNLLGASAKNGATMFDLRTNNTIAYISPNFSGVTIAAAYVADSGAGATPASCLFGGNTLDCNSRDAYSITADYTANIFMLGLGYETQNVSTVASGSYNRNLWRLVGGLNIAGFKLGGEYEQGSADNNVLVSDADRNAWGLFASWSISAFTLKANYLSVGDYSNVNDSSADQWTLGADYAMSKRTTAYAYYASVNNNTNSGFGLGLGAGSSDATGSTLGADPTVFGIGMKHAF